MRKVLITGSQGFIGSYLCQELLDNGYEVWGIDNFSKYGKVVRPHDKHRNFHFIEGDAKNLESILTDWFIEHNEYEEFLTFEFDYIIALAAKIGGISYFHKYAFDLFKENEDIMSATYNFAIRFPPKERVVVISSSMVYENTDEYPTYEDETMSIPPPNSSYGRQKLVSEWWAEAAWEQYKIPYTIIRPFNCVGVGEEKALGTEEITNGNITLLLSHVLPDLINKVLKGQDPLHILGEGNQIRCYTNGKDIARGIRMAMENKKAINEAFNISSFEPITVLELAKKVYKEITGNELIQWVSDKPYEYDVQKRIPCIYKAEEILGFKAEISIDESIKEVVEYFKGKVE